MFGSKSKIFILIFGVSILFNIFLVILFFINRPSSSTSNRYESSNFPYLSTRIFLNDDRDRIINFVELRLKLQKSIRDSGKDIGLYFEYLPSGISIGVNEKNGYFLASLLKTPLVMAVYKESEKKNIDFNKELTIEKKHINSQFGNLWEKGEGTKITIEEAAKTALLESDNTAYLLLHDLLGKDVNALLSNVFDSLDIPREKQSALPIVTPKNYSSILRSLYFSSYLSIENSNLILEDLSNTKFDEKIKAGVPSNIKVAHKIGTFESEGGSTTYSDCGIVYVPKRPYILCIMTSGLEENEANYYMKYNSKLIYDFVSSINFVPNNKPQ